MSEPVLASGEENTRLKIRAIWNYVGSLRTSDSTDPKIRCNSVVVENIYTHLGNAATLRSQRLVMALLGGFSVSLVYRILNHLLTSIEALVRGDARELRQANEQLDKARATEAESANRLQLLAKLNSLQQKLHTSKNTQEILMEFEKIQQQIAMHGPFESPSPEALMTVQNRSAAVTSASSIPDTASATSAIQYAEAVVGINPGTSKL